MVAKVEIRTRGGERLKRWVQEKEAEGEAMRGIAITVGFHERHIASLAALLEIGKGTIPARPAFETSIPRVKEAARSAIRAELVGVGTIDRAGAQRIADTAAQALRDGYLDFAESGSPALSARQARRKRGTRGAGKLLVGARGPRLINRIEGRAWKL